MSKVNRFMASHFAHNASQRAIVCVAEHALHGMGVVCDRPTSHSHTKYRLHAYAPRMMSKTSPQKLS